MRSGARSEGSPRHQRARLGSLLRRAAGRILAAWRDGKLALIVSPAIVDEYHRVGRVLASRYDGADLEPFLVLVAVHAKVVDDVAAADGLCEDPHDDKFMARALAGGADVVVSGDKHLRGVSGWSAIEVISPRGFVDQHLP